MPSLEKTSVLREWRLAFLLLDEVELTTKAFDCYVPKLPSSLITSELLLVPRFIYNSSVLLIPLVHPVLISLYQGKEA